MFSHNTTHVQNQGPGQLLGDARKPPSPGPGRLSSLYIYCPPRPRLPHAVVSPSFRPSSPTVMVAPRFYYLKLGGGVQEKMAWKEFDTETAIAAAWLSATCHTPWLRPSPDRPGSGSYWAPPTRPSTCFERFIPARPPPAIRGASAPCPKRESLWPSRGIIFSDERIPARQSSIHPSYSVFILICPQDPAPLEVKLVGPSFLTRHARTRIGPSLRRRGPCWAIPAPGVAGPYPAVGPLPSRPGRVVSPTVRSAPLVVPVCPTCAA